MNSLRPLDIENTVIELCNSFTGFNSAQQNSVSTENSLWKGMTTCVLSSQVGYETASAFAEELAIKELLPPCFDEGFGEHHEQSIFKELSTPIKVANTKKKYRFPKARARQIAYTAEHFFINQLSLSEIFANDNDPKSIRVNLVKNVSGLGPKQASMFIRDSNKSENLAIIDRHILHYMYLLGLASEHDINQFSASKYLQFERELEQYSHFLGFPVGRVDWAIWIVMRTLKRGNLH